MFPFEDREIHVETATRESDLPPLPRSTEAKALRVGVTPQGVQVVLPARDGALQVSSNGTKISTTSSESGELPVPEEVVQKVTQMAAKVTALPSMMMRIQDPATPALRREILQYQAATTTQRLHDAMDSARDAGSESDVVFQVAEEMKQCEPGKCVYEKHFCKVCGWMEEIPEDPKAEAAFLLWLAIGQLKTDASTVEQSNRLLSTAEAWQVKNAEEITRTYGIFWR